MRATEKYFQKIPNISYFYNIFYSAVLRQIEIERFILSNIRPLIRRALSMYNFKYFQNRHFSKNRLNLMCCSCVRTKLIYFYSNIKIRFRKSSFICIFHFLHNSVFSLPAWFFSLPQSREILLEQITCSAFFISRTKRSLSS